MEPISALVGALVAAAAAAATDIATSELKSAYSKLKSTLLSKFGVDATLDATLDNNKNREKLVKALDKPEIINDQQIVQLASKIFEQLEKRSSDELRSIGLHLKEVQAGKLTLGTVAVGSGATGILLERGKVDEVKIESVSVATDDILKKK